MSKRRSIVVQCDGSLLRAVEVDAEGSRPSLRHAIIRAVPEEEAGDPRRLAAWIDAALGEAGFGGGPRTVALAREELAVRALAFPSASDDDLPGMVRLAMQKEPALETAGAVVDFRVGSRDATGVRVLAAGLPTSSLERIRGLAADPLAVSPRFLGAIGGVIGSAAPSADETLVVLDATGTGLESTVVRGAEILWSRGAACEASPEAVASEAKRAWMALRLALPDLEVTRVVALGDPATTAELSAALARTAGLAVRAVDADAAIRRDPGIDPAIAAACLPLVGLAATPRDELLDFAHPRRPPDVAAARRKRLLVAAGLALVAAFAGWTVGQRERVSYLERVDDLREKATAALPEHKRFKRDALKLKHLDAWASIRPRWLDHALYLHGFAPDARRVVLDEWNGTLEASEVSYGRDRSWSVTGELKVVLDGEARDRETADAFREALVGDRTYTLKSTGADGRGGKRLGSPFSYLLRSAKLGDPAESPAKPKGGAS